MLRATTQDFTDQKKKILELSLKQAFADQEEKLQKLMQLKLAFSSQNRRYRN